MVRFKLGEGREGEEAGMGMGEEEAGEEEAGGGNRF